LLASEFPSPRSSPAGEEKALGRNAGAAERRGRILVQENLLGLGSNEAGEESDKWLLMEVLVILLATYTCLYIHQQI
jgi:hypothetical protein